MRRRRIVVVSVVLGLSLLVVGCGGSQPVVSVKAGETTVAGYRDQAKVSVEVSAPGRDSVAGDAEFTKIPAVHMLSFSQADKGVFEVYAFGVAPAGTGRLELEPGDSHSSVAPDGTFVAITQGTAPIPIVTVHWRFVSASDIVIAEGDGPTQ